MFVRVMPSDYKRVLEQEAARLKEEKKRMSTIDLVPSHTASQVDLASEAIEEVFSQKGLLTSAQPRSTSLLFLAGLSSPRSTQRWTKKPRVSA